MTSTATEAASSPHQDGQLAIRLFPASPRAPNAAAASPALDQSPQDVPVRRRPKKPAIPRHPIPTMQEAFAESLAEVTSGTLSMKPKLRVDTPQIRRDRLLDQDKSEPAPAALWRMRPAQNCHELRKLLAQISFGVYLLLKGMANSDAQVVAILQGHIDEVDDFLKTAMEDLKLATQDLNTRLDYLKLPLGNLPAFEDMLEDREFRLRIVEGNVRIEHILSRTTTALLQTVQDVSEGLRATKEFTAYLAVEEHGSWRAERPPEVADIFQAMRGNADGWLNALADLEEKTNTLDLLISKLADMVTEMDRCAGEVSRRTRFSVKPFTLPELTSRVSQDAQGSTLPVSYEATPPLSPGISVPPVPPRLSLRFSGLSGIMTPNFLDLDSSNVGLGSSAPLPPSQYTPPAEVSDSNQDASKSTPSNPFDRAAETNQADGQSAGSSPPDFDGQDADAATIRSSKTAIRDADAAASDAAADSDLMPIPLRIDFDVSRAGSPTPPSDAPTNKDTSDEEPLFILQPRTYTPQPTTPLPSPRHHEGGGSQSPFQELWSQPRSRGEAPSPRLYIAPVEERLSYGNTVSPASPRVQSGGSSSSRQSPSIMVSPSTSVSSERTVDANFSNGIPKKKTSIRERVSLRTTPPDAIQVPPPNAPQLQRPVFVSPRTYQNYRTFTGPDSAYSSDRDRTGSVRISDVPPADARASSHDYSPPPTFPPNMVPSPHSDQQYFRPVQASPHSPLQQRPHTAGQVPSRPYHLRNAPSTMGMSMLSSVTTMTQDSKGQPVLKKKRSAFSWLKKAFTLDEDERVSFDQRRQAEGRNLYYDGRSPKFLDGKRIK